ALASRITSSSVPRAATGRWKVPPIAPRSAFHPNGFAEPSTAITPVAPHAAAVLTIAPTLPGSCSPARISTRGDLGSDPSLAAEGPVLGSDPNVGVDRRDLGSDPRVAENAAATVDACACAIATMPVG